jgi:hypothetical protein
MPADGSVGVAASRMRDLNTEVYRLLAMQSQRAEHVHVQHTMLMLLLPCFTRSNQTKECVLDLMCRR